ncbi:Thiaminase II [Aphelenchoides besseyi]|nr:Thiaminase II [Aphelenchoides besseyi]KAI6193632.1 Thiaminase II [Aphelenchoides besseyi]
MKTQKFSTEAWNRNKQLYDSTLNHPFNKELCDGILSQEKFKYYVIQDTKYLAEYAKSFASAASCAKNPVQIAYLAKCAVDVAVGENSFHAPFFEKYNITIDEYKETEFMPAAHHYTSFLHSTAQQKSLAVQLAALLPCALIYHKVGQHVKTSASPDNPFQIWIDQYGSEEFAGSVARMITLVDEIAEKEPNELEYMHEAYTRSARLEYLFWDDAYNLRKWPC